MALILRDPRLDTRINRCILINMIVPELKGNAKLAKNSATVRMAVARKMLECSKTTIDRALRAELGMCPLQTYRDTRKSRWQHGMKNMQSKRSPAIDDWAI